MNTKPSRIRFYPFAYALFTEELCNYCWYCLTPVETKKRCLGCGFALFCDKECQSLGWKDHKAECKGLRNTSSIPDIEIRMLGRIVLRHKEICSGKDRKTKDFYKDRTSNRSLLEIWAHSDLMCNDHHAIAKFEDIYKKLVDFYEAKFMLPKEVVFELHCRDYINRHAISDRGYMKEIGKGLYLDLCAYDHSCRPNTIYTCNGFIATLRALNSDVVMQDRSKTFYSYIDLLSSLQQRKKQLKDTWYFDCNCERCTDPDDHILTSILCPCCPPDERETLSIFGEHSHKDSKSARITCMKCGNEVPKDYVVEAVSAMRFIDKIIEDREVEQMPRRSREEFLEDLLNRFAKILSSANIYLCKLIQILIPLISSDNNGELLRLHLQAESCVRRCFPHNHPATAFHLRNIAIFLDNLNRHEEAARYFREADEILDFTLDSDHPMTVENRELLEKTLKNLGETEKDKKWAVSSVKNTVVCEANLSNDKLDDIAKNVDYEKQKKIKEEVEKSEKCRTVVNKPVIFEEESLNDIDSGRSHSHADLFSDDLSDLPELVS